MKDWEWMELPRENRRGEKEMGLERPLSNTNNVTDVQKEQKLTCKRNCQRMAKNGDEKQTNKQKCGVNYAK